MHTTSEGEKPVFSACSQTRKLSNILACTLDLLPLGVRRAGRHPHLARAAVLGFVLGLILAVELGDRGGEEGWLGTPLLALLVIKQELVFSGMIGSGLCVFSKHPIQEIFQHVYSLNGYPYMVRISSLSLLTQTGRSLPGALAGGCQYPEFLSSLACSSIMETGSVGSLWGCWCSV
jgi:hypothetical protein